MIKMDSLELINSCFKKFNTSYKYQDLLELLNLTYEKECYNIVVLLHTLYYDHYKTDDFTLLTARSNHHLGKYRDSWNNYKNVINTNNDIIIESYNNIPFLLLDFDLHVNNHFKLNTQPIVTLTMTSCKRFELFEKTVNSILQYVDINLIYQFICIDDNSSESDREMMMNTFPFFEYVWKGYNEKGHAKSMNMILKMVKTPFVFHVEDDWQFFDNDHYIKKCLNVLESDKKYGQCLINRNYAETIQDVHTVGGILQKTSSTNQEYLIHEFVPDTKEFISKYGYVPNCSYWPHFSLRVGLSKMSSLKEIGEFNESANHFEMDYAYRYADKGYVTTFLNNISCIHIGRLTKDRFDESKPNAYILNGENQFGNNVNNVNHVNNDNKINVNEINNSSTESSEETSVESTVEETPIIKNINIYYILVNLKERTDRLENMINEFKKQKTKFDFNVFSAVDGHKLVSTRQLEQLFNFNDFNYRRGMIGCALSHLNLWCALSTKEDDTVFVVLEDDVSLVADFNQKMQLLLYDMDGYDWNLVFLGHHLYNHCYTNYTFDEYRIPKCEKWSTQKSLQCSAGGTTGYMMNPKGARSLLTYLQTKGITNGIDTMIQKACDTLNIYYCDTLLVKSEFYQNNNEIDTDIQNNYDSMKQEFESRLFVDLKYYNDLGLRLITCNEDHKADHKNDEAMIFCFNSCNENVLYSIENIQVCTTSDVLDTYPIIKDIGLMKNNEFSVENLIKFVDIN